MRPSLLPFNKFYSDNGTLDEKTSDISLEFSLEMTGYNNKYSMIMKSFASQQFFIYHYASRLYKYNSL